jgi:pimeloyl-ACP methyl ester carboxylesterase
LVIRTFSSRSSFALLFSFLLLLSSSLAAHAFDEDYNETINGTTLHFRVRGTDKTHPYLLILHGGPGFSAHMFYPWGKSLEPTVNVVYMDQRGCGQSKRLTFADVRNPKPEEYRDYTIANLIEDAEGVRRFLKVDRWFVLGHSWGGMLGLEYVTAHPESVRGFIDMDGLVSQPACQDALLARLQTILEREADSQNDKTRVNAITALADVQNLRKMKPSADRIAGAFSYIPRYFGQIYYADPAKGQAYSQSIVGEMMAYKIPLNVMTANEPAPVLIHTDSYATRDDTPLLSKVSVPTLVIGGEQDGMIPVATEKLAHSKIKGSELLLLKQCGHFPFAEQPDETTAAILKFVAAHP